MQDKAKPPAQWPGVLILPHYKLIALNVAFLKSIFSIVMEEKEEVEPP